ncbi:uncharacterized protein [Coffea arabica]|uniref:RING-type domain-containing protein n=1 Tax=Coffea arabica TaxID=13443 RepID=A0ABM4UQK8_COFAR
MKFSEKPAGPSTRSRRRSRQDKSNNSSEPVDCEHYGKLLSGLQTDCIRNSGPLLTDKQQKGDDSNNTSDNHDNFHIESEYYGKVLSESQIDYIRNSGPLLIKKQQKKKVPQVVDQPGEDQTEKDLPDEFCEPVTISEPSSNTNPKRRRGRKAEASPSNTTLSSAKKASTSKKKIKAQSPAPPASPTPPTPTRDHHITWDFFDETSASVDQICPLCENDLSSTVLEVEDEYEVFGVEQVTLPCVAILACGHAFHSECLESITPPDQRTDPPCIFCLSCVT